MILLNFKLRFEYKILCASIDAGANAISFRKKNKRRPGNTWTHEEGWVTGSARGVQTQLHNQQRSQKDAAVTSGHQTARPYTSVYASSAAHTRWNADLREKKEGLPGKTPRCSGTQRRVAERRTWLGDGATKQRREFWGLRVRACMGSCERRQHHVHTCFCIRATMDEHSPSTAAVGI
jgi:hypothetical protein